MGHRPIHLGAWIPEPYPNKTGIDVGERKA